MEQNAAAAKALEQQSKAMDDQVGLFQLGEAPSAARTPAARERSGTASVKPAAPEGAKRQAAPAKRGVVGRMQAAIATAFKPEPQWKEF